MVRLEQLGELLLLSQAMWQLPCMAEVHPTNTCILVAGEQRLQQHLKIYLKVSHETEMGIYGKAGIQ